MVLDKEQIKKILSSELEYTPIEAVSFVREFPAIHDELSKAVQGWLEDRTISDINAFGLSIQEYMRTHHAHFLMAIRDLNRLYDNDLTPERRNRLIEILRNPDIRW